MKAAGHPQLAVTADKSRAPRKGKKLPPPKQPKLHTALLQKVAEEPGAERRELVFFYFVGRLAHVGISGFHQRFRCLALSNASRNILFSTQNPKRAKDTNELQWRNIHGKTP